LCLEGNAPIPLDVGPQILDRFRQDFDVAPEGPTAADRPFLGNLRRPDSASI
jgi:hypothetical protein